MELRRMKDQWWKVKAAELQKYADEHSSKMLIAGLKTVYGPYSNAKTPVCSADGILLNEEDIVQRWADHFSKLLNKTS